MKLLVIVLGCVNLAGSRHTCSRAVMETTWDPICADNKTFQNPSALHCYEQFVVRRQLRKVAGVCGGTGTVEYCSLVDTVTMPVCGTDGVKYKNMWELQCTAQRDRKEIGLSQLKVCKPKCDIPLEYKPVCGMITYPNQEAMDCLHGKKMTPKREGECLEDNSDPCDPSPYESYDSRYCASNGMTYTGYRSILCLRRQNSGLRIVHDGPCMVEEVAQLDDTELACFLARNVVLRMPVCGSDNVTYANPYALRCKAQEKAGLELSHAASCSQGAPPEKKDLCSEEATGDGHRSICLSDGKTYRNLQEVKCARKKYGLGSELQIISRYQACSQHDDPCESIKRGHHLMARPICASDGKTYFNTIAMLCAAASNPDLRKVHSKPCVGDAEEPATEQQP